MPLAKRGRSAGEKKKLGKTRTHLNATGRRLMTFSHVFLPLLFPASLLPSLPARLLLLLLLLIPLLLLPLLLPPCVFIVALVVAIDGNDVVNNVAVQRLLRRCILYIGRWTFRRWPAPLFAGRRIWSTFWPGCASLMGE